MCIRDRVFVDPTNTRRDYYHFSTNTLGTKFEGRVFNSGWNGAWESAAKLGEDQWTAEIAIPFETVGASTPSWDTKWALNLTRNVTASGGTEHLTWAVPYGSFHNPDRFGTAVFGGATR